MNTTALVALLVAVITGLGTRAWDRWAKARDDAKAARVDVTSVAFTDAAAIRVELRADIALLRTEIGKVDGELRTEREHRERCERDNADLRARVAVLETVRMEAERWALRCAALQAENMEMRRVLQSATPPVPADAPVTR